MKSSVTLYHPEGYILSTLLPLSALPVCVTPVRPLTIGDMLLFAAIGLTGLFGLYRAASREELGESGIFLKRPFVKRQYRWTDIETVQLAPLNTSRGRVPVLLITLPDRSAPLRLRCTGDSLAVLRNFYGEPDEDAWGNGIS